MNESRRRVVLSYDGVGRNGNTNRNGNGNRNGVEHQPASFVQETIQPSTTTNQTTNRTTNQTAVATRTGTGIESSLPQSSNRNEGCRPFERRSHCNPSPLVPTLIQTTQAVLVQPRTTIVAFDDSDRCNCNCNCNAFRTTTSTKKRPRFVKTKTKTLTTTTTTTNSTTTLIDRELRIEGDKVDVDGVVEEIRAMAVGASGHSNSNSSSNNHGSTSVYLKNIRGVSIVHRRSDSEFDDEFDDVDGTGRNRNHDHNRAPFSFTFSPLCNAIRDLVEHRGRCWKRIRIHECSPWIVEMVLASPHCSNVEELHLVGVRDEDDNENDDNENDDNENDDNDNDVNNDNDDDDDNNEEPHEPEGGVRSTATAPRHPQREEQEEEPPSRPLPPEARHPGTEPAMSTVCAAPSTIGIDRLVVSLLRKTKRLKKVVLKGCNLKNSALLRIMNVLCSHPNHPKSLEHLDLRFNRLTRKVIESIVAIHLRSSLHALKTIKLRQGIRCVVHRSIRDAILRGLGTNRVILESIDVFDWDKSVQFFLDANRAKRRTVFCNNDRFSRNLWPLLLEQAVAIGNQPRRDEHEHEHEHEHEQRDEHNEDVLAARSPLPFRLSSSSIRMTGGRFGAPATRRRQASVVYHLFRNGGPMLLEQQSHAANPTAQ